MHNLMIKHFFSRRVILLQFVVTLSESRILLMTPFMRAIPCLYFCRVINVSALGPFSEDF